MTIGPRMVSYDFRGTNESAIVNTSLTFIFDDYIFNAVATVTSNEGTCSYS